MSMFSVWCLSLHAHTTCFNGPVLCPLENKSICAFERHTGESCKSASLLYIGTERYVGLHCEAPREYTSNAKNQRKETTSYTMLFSRQGEG